MKIIKTVCARDCPDTCFVDATVKDGKLIKTKGCEDSPFTQGFTCPRGVGDVDRVYSDKRIKKPYVKSGKSITESFKDTYWEDAISKVSKALKETIEEHGKESVLLYDYPGNQSFLAWQYPRRLWNAIGATTTDYALCSNSGHEGIAQHYGLTYGIQPSKISEYKIIVFWGNNAKISAPHQWVLAQKAKKENNAIIVCVDPRNSETAQSSDLWIQPRPGSDVALCYGIAHQLILKKGVDKSFISKWTSGYTEYSIEAEKWPAVRVEKITNVRALDIQNLTDLFIENNGSVAFMIGLGLNKSNQGAESVRAVSLLPALMGEHRGFYYSNSRGYTADWGYINGNVQTNNKGKVVNQVSIGDRIENGEFKFIFVLGANPSVTLPNSNSVIKGLNRNDVFVVVQDTHWSETAELADVVLPAPTYLEKTDINFSDHHPYNRLSNKAVEPLFDSKDEVWVMHELAKKLMPDCQWLFEDPWDALKVALSGTYKNGDFDDILKGESLEIKLKKENAYQTVSGRIEFSSNSAVNNYISKLPFQEQLDSAKGTYVLLNSSIPKYTNSQFTDVYGPIPEIVWINSQDANEIGVVSGDLVELYNDYGVVTVKATVTNRTPSGVCWAPRPLIGLNGQPLNTLVPGVSQELGGGPMFNSTRIRINRIDDNI